MVGLETAHFTDQTIYNVVLVQKTLLKNIREVFNRFSRNLVAVLVFDKILYFQNEVLALFVLVAYAIHFSNFRRRVNLHF